ncbi:LOW QUALITY PROTEIN: Glycoside hydrolase [Parasponia andersonii]|uniref:Glycoside hydrolase n=1 Tax=Parasponia andersonii TaxID=3476 RepID=A0A2P5BUQ1_PARAD|nr:LOW QUALITY PROTEIN: Glycoside hydrolase [Parasponia andersonii]
MNRTHDEVLVGYTGPDPGLQFFKEDVVTEVRYRNLFDMMVDIIICAMMVSGHQNIPMIVTEARWRQCH